ncbi:MAG: hypothetical protein LBU92_04115 [Prevotellaceae bacterium]|jgi:hypothetical protein|nr:hypothetical protein [Prevotellaceae bacterium]
MATISIDTAAEVLAFLIAHKLKTSDTATGTELALLNSEISLLQQERQIIYGEGSKQDFERVMEKVDTVYAPIVKNAVTGNYRTEHLSAA